MTVSRVQRFVVAFVSASRRSWPWAIAVSVITLVLGWWAEWWIGGMQTWQQYVERAGIGFIFVWLFLATVDYVLHR
jgi:uncharacterized membrane protein HdeD (DUF308 family)